MDKDRKLWCNDEDAQTIKLPVRCRGMIHRTYPVYATCQKILNFRQYAMIMTCRDECSDQRNCRERKGKVMVFDNGDVETSDEEDGGMEDEVDGGAAQR